MTPTLPIPGCAEPEETEQLQVKWLAFDEAMHMVARGEITDALTILGLQRVALMRRGLA